ncbi:hypothetical protein [Streptomyces sp. IBSBF 3136]|uniref:hypothetical protein n=1 Tax=Streptomyces sp. IBSBF 3136 TaxID=2903524 RepID=UPI003FA68CB1
MGGTDFPDDLMQPQAAWNATYDALAAPRHRDTTVLRRRLLLLSGRLWWHPYRETAPSVPVARSELRQLTRARRAQSTPTQAEYAETRHPYGRLRPSSITVHRHRPCQAKHRQQ